MSRHLVGHCTPGSLRCSVTQLASRPLPRVAARCGPQAIALGAGLDDVGVEGETIDDGGDESGSRMIEPQSVETEDVETAVAGDDATQPSFVGRLDERCARDVGGTRRPCSQADHAEVVQVTGLA